MKNEIFEEITVKKIFNISGVLPQSVMVEITDVDKSIELTSNVNFRSEDFVDRFNCYYFTGKQNGLSDCPKGIKKTKEGVEKTIDKILYKNDSWNKSDVFNILAWKTGKINQEQSEEDNIVPAKSWDKENNIIQLPNQSKTKLGPFAEKVIELRANYQKDSSTENAIYIWKDMVNYLVEDEYKNDIKGLGTVYLVTLFSFITRGEYPIFDRFAMAALTSFYFQDNDVTIPNKSIISGCKLPSKKEKINDVFNLISDDDGIYKKYINLLKKYYGNKWKNDRKYDRALWVYGHYFIVS